MDRDARSARAQPDGSGERAGGVDYLQRRERYAVLGRGAAAALREVDALVCPTVPISPPAMAEITDDDIYHRTNLRMLRNTCVVNFLGLCAVTLPVGRDRVGMPVGMQLIGRPAARPGSWRSRSFRAAAEGEGRAGQPGDARPSPRPTPMPSTINQSTLPSGTSSC